MPEMLIELQVLLRDDQREARKIREAALFGSEAGACCVPEVLLFEARRLSRAKEVDGPLHSRLW